ncbi:MAG: cobalt-precorrin-6A reductase [Pseudomonadota bacterium]
MTVPYHKIMVLGGTAEAGELAARLAGDDRLATVTSLAGLTRLPSAIAGPVRRGGSGGPDGLAATLREERYDALIDATHPFAGRIAAHAAEAAQIAGIPRIKLVRPAFSRPTDLIVTEVEDMAAAAEKVPADSRVFLAAGRREITAFAGRTDLWCLVRMIEPPTAGETLPPGQLIFGRPNQSVRDEITLLREHRIDMLVAKDSGGPASAKIEAAAQLQLPVILIRRPDLPAGDIVADVDDVLAWIEKTLFAQPA